MLIVSIAVEVYVSELKSYLFYAYKISKDSVYVHTHIVIYEIPFSSFVTVSAINDLS